MEEQPARDQIALTVLIVEPDDARAALLALPLRTRWGGRLQLQRARTADEALAISPPLEATIIGPEVGGMTGLELTRQLRQAERQEVIILLTHDEQEETLTAAIRAGADEAILDVLCLEPGTALPHVLNLAIERRRVARQVAALHEQATRLAAALAAGRAMVHELSSPLTLIVGTTELLLAHEELPTSVTRQLTLISEQAIRLNDLLQQFGRLVRYAERPSPVGPMLDLADASC
ncbi:MAG: hypothetical protein KatS3mg061_0006 [Dehalococcoidia bacterium]|nr:MAG: hypothetical protein KatS3mg061_0006 [Dehalococcoidia bacterium]